MELGATFFKSKIGRRFFFLFLFCAFLPTVLLMLLSYQRVSLQLEEQSLLRLQKDTKSYGLSLLERLVRMENLLGLYAVKLSFTGNQHLDIKKQLEDQMSLLFTGAYLFTGTGDNIPLSHTIYCKGQYFSLPAVIRQTKACRCGYYEPECG